MDETSCRGREEARQPLPKPGPFTGRPCPKFNSVHVWLEDLGDPSSCQSSSSQPSSPSAPSNSPAGSGSSSECNGSLCSWSSGATGTVLSSTKRQSGEAFQTQGAGEQRWKKPSACPNRGPHPKVKQRGCSTDGAIRGREERDGLCEGRSSAQNDTSSRGGKPQRLLDDKVQAKLRFSKFLDEVTSNVLDPNSLQAFGRPASPTQTEDSAGEVTRWSPTPPCSMAQTQGSVLEQKTTDQEQAPLDPPQETYLETDIDAVRGDDSPHDQGSRRETPPQQEIDEDLVIPPPPQFRQGFEMRTLFPEFHCHLPRYPYRSASLPRGINMVSDETVSSLYSEPEPGTYVAIGADIVSHF